jgi:hypothetical protein
MAATSTCPYCNALLPPASAGGRVVCVRCGEAIPAALTEAVLGMSAAEPQPASVHARPSGFRWHPRGIVAAIFVVAAGVAAIWWGRNRSDSTSPATDSTRAAVRPAGMPGLGYLPPSTEVVLAIQLPLLLDRLGPEAAADPAKALKQMGLPEQIIETADKASGVGLDHVDHLVVGLSFARGALPPQLVIVLHTKAPFSLNAIMRETKANSLKSEERTLHAVRVSQFIEVNWWSPNDRVLVGTLLKRDFKDVPEQPSNGVDHFRTDMASLIRNDIPDGSCAWLVASSDRWAEYLRYITWLPGTPLSGRNDLIAPADRLRSVTVAIPHAADRQVAVELNLKTAQEAELLRAILSDRFEREPIEVRGEGTVCRVETPFDPKRIGSIISRLIPVK